MAKRWEDLTQAEKIEDLHREVKSVITTVNEHGSQLTQIHGQLNQLAEKLKDLTAHPRGQALK